MSTDEAKREYLPPTVRQAGQVRRRTYHYDGRLSCLGGGRGNNPPDGMSPLKQHAQPRVLKVSAPLVATPSPWGAGVSPLVAAWAAAAQAGVPDGLLHGGERG